MAGTPNSEPRCMRCGIGTQLHSISVLNEKFRFRSRMCAPCLEELQQRHEHWLARPQSWPGALRPQRLAAGLTVAEVARRAGLSTSHVSKIERGTIRGWENHARRIRAAISAQ